MIDQDARLSPARAWRQAPRALLVTAAFLVAGASPAPSQPTLDLDATADEIQRACLRAYPPDMLAAMADGKVEIPADVEADPTLQEDFLAGVIKGDKGRFYPFLLEDLLPSFEAYLDDESRFLDLGSGDGRVVFLANVLGADATGIEYDPKVMDVSERAAETLGEIVDPERLHLIEDDFFAHSWSGYDVIFYFDLSSFEQDKVRRKLALELDYDARLLVGHERAPFGGLEVETTFDFITVYRQPRKAEGHDPNFADRCRAEIADRHRFFEGWLNGTLGEQHFDRFTETLAPGFALVTPDGRKVYHDAVVQNMRRARGSWGREGQPGTGRIRIDNIRMSFLRGAVAVATFDEHTEVNGESKTFVNTAVFHLRYGTPNGVVWMHLHETEVKP